MSLTVVIPFRNSNKVIYETLESVLECKDFISDIICINNASEDESVDTVQKFFKDANTEFRLINNKRSKYQRI
jgi:glycosyltransferase involved in cell wall biosynthesis